MSKLRLGPLIDEKPVKLSIDVPGPLIRELTDYARVHAAANGLAEPLPPGEAAASVARNRRSSKPIEIHVLLPTHARAPHSPFSR